MAIRTRVAKNEHIYNGLYFSGNIPLCAVADPGSGARGPLTPVKTTKKLKKDGRRAEPQVLRVNVLSPSDKFVDALLMR